MHSILALTTPPEQLSKICSLIQAVSYRVPCLVTHMVQYAPHGLLYPLCPRCKTGMDREYANFCDRCGQKLCWDKIDDAEILISHTPK